MDVLNGVLHKYYYFAQIVIILSLSVVLFSSWKYKWHIATCISCVISASFFFLVYVSNINEKIPFTEFSPDRKKDLFAFLIFLIFAFFFSRQKQTR